MKTLFAVTMIALSSAAYAQSTTAPSSAAPAAGPTQAQCTAGWQEGMAWTRDDFMKACAKFKSTN